MCNCTFKSNDQCHHATGIHLPGMPTPQPGNLSPNQVALQQQHLQRAFLQSAVAQNIQIQQHLMAQNQALQQLLSQSVPVRKHTQTHHFCSLSYFIDRLVLEGKGSRHQTKGTSIESQSLMWCRSEVPKLGSARGLQGIHNLQKEILILFFQHQQSRYTMTCIWNSLM